MNNVALDVFIGLIFIFLLYSLLASVIQEIVSRRFSLRARMLQMAIRRMLEDNDSLGRQTRNTFAGFWVALSQTIYRFFNPQKPGEDFFKAFYNHPTIKYLGENRLSSKPAYLHTSNFSQTIIHLLRGDQYDGQSANESELISNTLNLGSFAGNAIKPETLKHLRMLFADARRDSVVFRTKLEDWFEETMDRNTGWYKRQTQWILFFIGIGIAAAFDVDTIAITKILINDKQARDGLAAYAINNKDAYGEVLNGLQITRTTATESVPATDGKPGTVQSETVSWNMKQDEKLNDTYKKLLADQDAVKGILGLNALPADTIECQKMYADLYYKMDTTKDPRKKLQLLKQYNKQISACQKERVAASPYTSQFPGNVPGWIITALAISLGASFWFDLLQKLVQIRGAGPKPPPAGPSNIVPPAQTPTGSITDINNQPIRG